MVFNPKTLAQTFCVVQMTKTFQFHNTYLDDFHPLFLLKVLLMAISHHFTKILTKIQFKFEYFRIFYEASHSKLSIS